MATEAEAGEQLVGVPSFGRFCIRPIRSIRGPKLLNLIPFSCPFAPSRGQPLFPRSGKMILRIGGEGFGCGAGWAGGWLARALVFTLFFPCV